jgi:hypothetical protein
MSKVYLPLFCLVIAGLATLDYYAPDKNNSQPRVRSGNPPTDDPGKSLGPHSELAPVVVDKTIRDFSIMTTNKRARLAIIIQRDINTGLNISSLTQHIGAMNENRDYRTRHCRGSL